MQQKVQPVFLPGYFYHQSASSLQACPISSVDHLRAIWEVGEAKLDSETPVGRLGGELARFWLTLTPSLLVYLCPPWGGY